MQKGKPPPAEAGRGHSFLKVRPQLSSCRQPQLPDDQAARTYFEGGNTRRGTLPVVSRAHGYGRGTFGTRSSARCRGPSKSKSRTASRGLARSRIGARQEVPGRVWELWLRTDLVLADAASWLLLLRPGRGVGLHRRPRRWRLAEAYLESLTRPLRTADFQVYVTPSAPVRTMLPLSSRRTLVIPSPRSAFRMASGECSSMAMMYASAMPL